MLVPVCDPALGQVHPGAVGRGEVEREAGMALEPVLDRRGPVGGDVVQDDMHGEGIGHVLVDQVEEALELAGPLSWAQVGDHMSGGDPASSAGQAIQRRVEVSGAVSYVAVGLTAGDAGQHRPGRCGAVERLDLRLLVHAEHDRRLGRV